ncbi:MAG: FAD-dependent oxidoreductase, partial [Clostridia bacterium]|nr:FAD-dependent oxidoreductase [Clostridia bacterium]
MKYDVVIIGAGPGGIFAAYELVASNKGLKVAVFEAGNELSKRKCPIDGNKIKSCINCKTCSIMSGFGGAGAFSDGKYNITNDFGGTLYQYIGKEQALDLMHYVDNINMQFGGEGTKMYSTAGTKFKKLCIQNGLKLLDASVRHLGTDKNYTVLENIYNFLKDKVDFHFNTHVDHIRKLENGYQVEAKGQLYECEKCIISVGRSGSKWMEKVCNEMQ